MVELDLDEARLLRLLTGVFGVDRVLVNLSLLTLSGGKLPEGLEGLLGQSAMTDEQAGRCLVLFTIIDPEHEPQLAIDFVSDTVQRLGAGCPLRHNEAVDPVELEHYQRVRPLLRHLTIPYAPVTREGYLDFVKYDDSFDVQLFLKHCVAWEEQPRYAE